MSPPLPSSSSGRPSIYTDELAELICERLMDGESLRMICSSPAMPNRVTVLRWLGTNEAFRAKYAVARELQAEVADDKINDLIDNVTPESAPADRVRLAALQWRASKLAPKKYGDRIGLDHAGKVGSAGASALGLSDADAITSRSCSILS